MSPQWTSHRYHEVIASKAEVILLLKPLSDGTATHPEHRASVESPSAPSQLPQSSPNTSRLHPPCPKSKVPTLVQATRTLSRWRLPCGLPAESFVPLQSIFHTAARGILQKYPCHHVAPLFKSLRWLTKASESSPNPKALPDRAPGPTAQPHVLRSASRAVLSDGHLWAFAHPVALAWEVLLLLCHLADTTQNARLNSETGGTSSGKPCCPHKLGFRPLSLSPFIRAATVWC